MLHELGNVFWINKGNVVHISENRPQRGKKRTSFQTKSSLTRPYPAEKWVSSEKPVCLHATISEILPSNFSVIGYIQLKHNNSQLNLLCLSGNGPNSDIYRPSPVTTTTEPKLISSNNVSHVASPHVQQSSSPHVEEMTPVEAEKMLSTEKSRYVDQRLNLLNQFNNYIKVR